MGTVWELDGNTMENIKIKKKKKKLINQLWNRPRRITQNRPQPKPRTESDPKIDEF